MFCLVWKGKFSAATTSLCSDYTTNQCYSADLISDLNARSHPAARYEKLVMLWQAIFDEPQSITAIQVVVGDSITGNILYLCPLHSCTTTTVKQCPVTG